MTPPLRSGDPESCGAGSAPEFERRDLSQRAADRVTAAIGSWPFLITQTVIIVIWISLNLTAVARHWDPYPFILLNLLFSTQAAYAAPVLQLSANRAGENDRERARTDLETNRKALAEIRAAAESIAQLHESVGEIRGALNDGGPARQVTAGGAP